MKEQTIVDQRVELKPSLLSPDLVKVFAAWGEPSFRARQIARWQYVHHVFDPLKMADLPARLRERLAAETRPFSLSLQASRTADHGLTTKALFALADGSSVESVLMRYPKISDGRERRTVCVSSQVGCAVGCPFCATGLLGLKRQLSADEIVAQVLYFSRLVRSDEGPDARITNVVFMGEGEPLANFRNVWPAIERLNDPDGLNLGARRVTLSTSGLVPRIRELTEKPLQVGLAISLHAPSDDLRDRLVPVNRKYRISELIAACREYAAATHRRVSFEYAMMRDVNDSPSQAERLAELLGGFLSHVNLIPLNLVEGSPFKPTPRRQIDAFQQILVQRRISCTIRSTRGDDIDGACGQLRAAVEAGDSSPDAASYTSVRKVTS
jgi:23S rRNA (adenine2503-C2)-methyltransferase